MKKLTLSLLAIAMASCLSLTGIAQNDSSWLDAGTLKLKRTFTQTISIKGEELEKMPFANLGEAIGAWLYGAYSNPYNLLYVVDGVPLGDVNGYSIYDIEEIIFVENALMQINGVAGQQQLVLIRTKNKANSPHGFTAALQGGLVNRDLGQPYSGGHLKSNTNDYGQIYAGWKKNGKDLDLGLSADYLRDVLPSARADSLHNSTAYRLNRLRLNGYLNIRLGKKNEIALHIDYAPQTIDSVQHFILYQTKEYQDTHQHQHIITPTLKWHYTISKGWENELQVAYLYSGSHRSGLMDYPDTSAQLPPSQRYSMLNTDTQYAKHLYVRERMSYTWQAGGWKLTPAVNVSDEHIKVGAGTKTATAEFGFNHLGFSDIAGKGTLCFLTPSFEIAYRSALDLQAGLLTNISPKGNAVELKGSFPFASLTTELLNWRNVDKRPSLKLYASYAKTPNIVNNDYSLPDLVYRSAIFGPGYFSGYGDYYGPGIPGGTPGFQIVAFPTAATWVWGLGAGLSTADHRLQVSYRFERNKFITAVAVAGPFYGTYSYYPAYPAVIASSHHLGIMARILAGGENGFDWQSGLNATTVRFKVISLPYYFAVSYGAVGDLNGGPASWTGGWTNRLRYRNLSAGFDVLYHFNEDGNKYYANYFGPRPPKTNSLVLQNIYLAYRLQLSAARNIEIYLDSRNLMRGSQDDLTDGRRFYGIGAKMGI